VGCADEGDPALEGQARATSLFVVLRVVTFIGVGVLSGPDRAGCLSIT